MICFTLGLVRPLAPLAFALAVMTAVSIPGGRQAEACAPAYPAHAAVRIADEAAIIVWDEASRTEHFIRRATFTTTAEDFGFLVPTPNLPELAEAPDHVFASLERLTAPAVVYSSKIDGVMPGLLCAAPFYLFLSRSASSAAPAGPPVRVLDAKTVAGYDAVVLEADSATALAEWLKSHGYATRPALEEWLAPYIERRWKITAFKIAAGRDARAVATSAVRMSFKTDRPFFPYREPSDQREVMPAVHAPNAPDAPSRAPDARQESAGATTPGPAEPLPARLLRVFFVSQGRVDGAIGQAGGRPWPGAAVWADTIAASEVQPALGSVLFPLQHAWLTTFEDRSSPRPGIDDVFFSPSASSTPVKPKPIEVVDGIDVFIPLDVVALVIGGVIWLVKRAKRRRAEAGAAPLPPGGTP